MTDRVVVVKSTVPWLLIAYVALIVANAIGWTHLSWFWLLTSIVWFPLMLIICWIAFFAICLAIIATFLG